MTSYNVFMYACVHMLTKVSSSGSKPLGLRDDNNDVGIRSGTTVSKLHHQCYLRAMLCILSYKRHVISLDLNHPNYCQSCIDSNS